MDPNVTAKVIEYLSKKGYSRTEAMLRMESANQDVEGRPQHSRSDESGGARYGKAFGRRYLDLTVSSLYCALLNPSSRHDKTMDRRESGNLQGW